MNVRFLLIAAALAMTLIASGCGDDQSSSATGGTLRLGQENGVTTLDQLAVDNNESIWAVQQITEPLVRVDGEGKVVPALAKSYELAADKLSWTFELRKGVKFSDGTPLKAADVKFTLDQAATSDFWGFLLEPIDRTEVRGLTTVVVHTKQPTAAVPAILGLFANGVMPKDYGGKSKAEYAKKPIGTGPFVVESFKPGNTLTLVRNKQYWQEGRPHLERVELVGISSETSRVSQVESGQLEVIANPPWSQLDALEQRDDISIEESSQARADLLILNASKAPFTDPTVREAASLALDREAIAKASLFGFGEAAGSFIAPAVPMHSGEAPAADPARARQLLSQSSYDGQPVALMINGEDAMSRTVGQLLQQQLEDVGMRVELTTLDLSSLLDNVRSGKSQMALSYLTSDIDDPSELASYFVVTKGLNSQVPTASFEGPVQRAAEEFDVDRRAELYADIQRRVAEIHGPVAIQYQPYVYALRSGIRGF